MKCGGEDVCCEISMRGCGEWIETTVDESAGSKQQYVEDCQVCCRPNVLIVRWDGSAQEFRITSELES
jgi:Cysteine-rich CPXCG